MDAQYKLDISIIGLGLIGGSIAKSIRRSGTECNINAFDKPEILDLAMKEGVIDCALLNIDDSLNDDIIFLCLPVDSSLSIFRQIAPRISSNTILTDVCGVKGVFQKVWKSIHSGGIYIGGHPMTGKEKGGYENSDPLLFENSVYIISQQVKETNKKEPLLKLIEKMGARIVFLDPFIHDKVVANVSHLPQLLSVALVNTASNQKDDINNLDFAAGGFRDMTRIASSDFNIWQSVFKLNRKEILFAINAMQRQLTDIENYIETDNSEELSELFESAREKRDSIPKNTKGFMHPLFDIFVYVKDQPGIISKISTALFNKDINIKDIELLKIREGTGGTFRLSFETNEDGEKAKVTLNEIGFTTL